MIWASAERKGSFQNQFFEKETVKKGLAKKRKFSF
jgi:hypothetical protein